MTYKTIISALNLLHNYQNPNWVLVDCRFSLASPESGRNDYHLSHIPGAVYAHLDEDLCGPIRPGITGRHPLPDVDQLSQTLSRWGITTNTQVVVYDDSGGSFASRLWFLLRWLGHDSVAVLDGGWPEWIRNKYPVEGGSSRPLHRQFIPSLRAELILTASELLDQLDNPEWVVIDSRAPERYRGEVEPIDPIAGRIPQSVNLFHADTIGEDGRFKPPDELRSQFTSVISGIPPSQVVFYCGSGVTAARNVLAMAHAGLGDARLYVGSWSEWITDPSRPFHTG